ncbi:MAG TPA: hypothetical protein PKE29_01225 [Phycisphaerales bacterium]|nr:hypothetical protein [Phycisphaerales bacterium]
MRIPAGAFPAIRPCQGAGDRPALGRDGGSYPAHLRRVNAARDFGAVPARPPTYPEHLRRMNDQIDLQAGRSRDSLRIPSDRPTCGVGRRVIGVPECGDCRDGPRTTPTGYLLPLPERIPRLVIEETYHLRNLLSRGAIIDLAG